MSRDVEEFDENSEDGKSAVPEISGTALCNYSRQYEFFSLERLRTPDGQQDVGEYPLFSGGDGEDNVGPAADVVVLKTSDARKLQPQLFLELRKDFGSGAVLY